MGFVIIVLQAIKQRNHFCDYIVFRLIPILKFLKVIIV